MSEESKDHNAITAIKRYFESICWSYFEHVENSSKEQIKLEIVKGKCLVDIDEGQTEEMAEFLRRLQKSIETTKAHDKWLVTTLDDELAYYRIAVRMFLEIYSEEIAKRSTDEWEVLTDMVGPEAIFSEALEETRATGMKVDE